MKKLLGIVVLGLLWCNVGIAAGREPGTDTKCLYVFERENVFERKFLPKVNKDKGVFVTYVGCNKYYDNWSYDYSLASDIDEAHERAYYGCVDTEMPQYNLTGCHLFSINDTIVYGKDAAFVAEVEKEAKAKLTTKAVTGCIEGDCNNGQGTETFENGYKYVGEWYYGQQFGGENIGNVNYVLNYAISYGNFFTKKSPTTYKKLTFNKEKTVNTLKGDKLSDLRRNKKKKFKSFQFTAEYEDNITVEIFVEHQDDAKILKEQKPKHLNMPICLVKCPIF